MRKGIKFHAVRVAPPSRPREKKPAPAKVVDVRHREFEPAPIGDPGALFVGGCKWFHGDEVQNFRQCGAATVDKNWCAHHAARLTVRQHSRDPNWRRPEPGAFDFSTRGAS